MKTSSASSSTATSVSETMFVGSNGRSHVMIKRNGLDHTSASPKGAGCTRFHCCKYCQLTFLPVTFALREAIAKAAESHKADLLILGSHGKGVTKRLVLGSVSDYCARNAAMPVLIHRPK